MGENKHWWSSDISECVSWVLFFVICSFIILAICFSMCTCHFASSESREDYLKKGIKELNEEMEKDNAGERKITTP